MDFNRVAWFTSGLLVGSILNTTTTLALLLAWMVVENKALPMIMGGYHPQQIIAGGFRYLGFLKEKSITEIEEIRKPGIVEIQDPNPEIEEIQRQPKNSNPLRLVLTLPQVPITIPFINQNQ